MKLSNARSRSQYSSSGSATNPSGINRSFRHKVGSLAE